MLLITHILACLYLIYIYGIVLFLYCHIPLVMCMVISYWLPNSIIMSNGYHIYAHIYNIIDSSGTLFITQHPPSYNVKRMSHMTVVWNVVTLLVCLYSLFSGSKSISSFFYHSALSMLFVWHGFLYVLPYLLLLVLTGFMSSHCNM